MFLYISKKFYNLIVTIVIFYNSTLYYDIFFIVH